MSMKRTTKLTFNSLTFMKQFSDRSSRWDQGWLFLQLHGIFHCMGAEWCFQVNQVKNRFFPSSDIMTASALKIFQLKELHFEHPRDLT